jgi:hypothetical protein
MSQLPSIEDLKDVVLNVKTLIETYQTTLKLRIEQFISRQNVTYSDYEVSDYEAALENIKNKLPELPDLAVTFKDAVDQFDIIHKQVTSILVIVDNVNFPSDNYIRQISSIIIDANVPIKRVLDTSNAIRSIIEQYNNSGENTNKLNIDIPDYLQHKYNNLLDCMDIINKTLDKTLEPIRKDAVNKSLALLKKKILLKKQIQNYVGGKKSRRKRFRKRVTRRRNAHKKRSTRRR